MVRPRFWLDGCLQEKMRSFLEKHAFKKEKMDKKNSFSKARLEANGSNNFAALLQARSHACSASVHR
jgi:hypothetical protein